MGSSKIWLIEEFELFEKFKIEIILNFKNQSLKIWKNWTNFEVEKTERIKRVEF